MLGRVEVFRSMFILGRIATPDVPTAQTQAKVHPRIAHLQTLFTAMGVRLDVLDLIEMRTFSHRSPPIDKVEPDTTTAGSPTLFRENEVSSVLRITYSTGIKNRFSTVENSMPPTIAVPTECRPSLPAPVAKQRGKALLRNQTGAIRMG